MADRREVASGGAGKLPPSSSGPGTLLGQPPTQAILTLALPTMSVMVTAALSNVLYTYYVSRLGPEALAAVSLVFPITLIGITAVGGGLGAGAASAIARALGRNDTTLANLVAGEAVKLSVLCGVGFGLVVYFVAPTLFALMGGQGQVLRDAVIFARVLFAGSFISFSAAILDNIMRAAGDSRTPALWAMVSLASQVVLTPILMFPTGWGLTGAAMATLAAQLATVLPRLRSLSSGFGPSRLQLRFGPTSRRTTYRILQVALPAASSTFSNYLGLLVLTGIVARFGHASLAAYGLGTRLDFLLLTLTYGFAVAVLTLVGMSVGAGQIARAWQYVVHAAVWVGGSLVAVALCLFAYPNLWLTWFTQDAQVLEIGGDYLRWVAPSYPFVGLTMISAFAFQGTGQASLPLVWTLIRVTAVISATVIAVFVWQLPCSAVFACVSVGNVCSGVMLAWMLRRHFEVLGKRHTISTEAHG